jgi:hypothetical protein
MQNGTTPVGLRLYNTYDGLVPPTNYERGIFDWNTTPNVLTIGTPPSSHGGTGVARETRFYTLGLPSLYVVPNASGNNWFEGNSGNFGVTGSGNFSTGDGVLASLTSGSGNVIIGGSVAGINIASGAAITTGNNNTVLGAGGMIRLTTGSNNVSMGSRAMEFITASDNNFAVGSSSLRVLGASGTGGSNNTGVGSNSLSGLDTGDQNVAIGQGAGHSLNNGSGNVFIGGFGNGAAANVTSGSFNTFIGGWAGPSAAINDMIVFSGGRDQYSNLDFRLTTPNIFSINYDHVHGMPVGLHIYNVEDATPPTNYERGILDWNVTANVFRLASQAGGTGTVRLIAVDGFQKAGSPAAGDLPSGTFALINDTSGGQTWLAYNAAGTIRKVQLT